MAEEKGLTVIDEAKRKPTIPGCFPACKIGCNHRQRINH